MSSKCTETHLAMSLFLSVWLLGGGLASAAPSAAHEVAAPVPCEASGGTTGLRDLGIAFQHAMEGRGQRPWIHGWILARRLATPDGATASALDQERVTVDVPWPSEMGWDPSPRALFVVYGRFFVRFAFVLRADGARGFEVHYLAKSENLTGDRVGTAARTASIARFLAKLPQALEKNKRSVVERFLDSVTVSAIGPPRWAGTGPAGAQIVLGRDGFRVMAGQCLFFDWNGHRVEVVVHNVDLEEPGSSEHRPELIDVSFAVSW